MLRNNMKIRKDHKCPYLEQKIFCTHKSHSGFPSKKKRLCPYNNISKCILLKEQENAITGALKALEQQNKQGPKPKDD